MMLLLMIPPSMTSPRQRRGRWSGGRTPPLFEYVATPAKNSARGKYCGGGNGDDATGGCCVLSSHRSSSASSPRRCWRRHCCYSPSSSVIIFLVVIGAHHCLPSSSSSCPVVVGGRNLVIGKVMPHQLPTTIITRYCGFTIFLRTIGQGKGRVQNLNSNPEGMSY